MGERQSRRALEASVLESFPVGIAEGETRGSRIKWLVVGVGCLIAAGWVAGNGLARAETTSALETNSVVGPLMGAGFFAVLALFSFGLVVRPRSTTSFRLINATVLTRAERPTADSWVHLAQTSTQGLPTILGFSLAGLVCTGIAVYAGLQAFGVIPQVNTDVSAAGPVLATLFMSVLAALLLWIASLAIRRQIRNGTVGARPSGVALGETAVAVNVPGRDVEIPWTQISSIDIAATLPAANDRPVPPMIRITLTLGPVPERVQMLAGSGYRVPVSALYTALRWYLARPDARWELGRIEGERRLAAWCAAGRGVSNSR